MLAILATSIATYSPATSAQSIAVQDATVTSAYPSGLTFSLTASSDSPITSAELLYRRANLETESLAIPDFEPATSIDVSVQTNFVVNFLPPGVDITYRWRLTDADGDVLETAPSVAEWRDTRFTWDAYEAADVTVYAYNGNDAYNQLVLDRAQRTAERLQEEFEVDLEHRIRLWVYNSREDFAGAQAANSEGWYVGAAYLELQLILVVLPEGTRREIARVVPHEISHQVIAQATENPFNSPPTWLDEGIALVNQEVGNEDFPAMVERAAEEGRLFSIRALNSEFPFDPADATLAYAQSYSVVSFIVDRWGEEGLKGVVAAYRQGVTHDDALRAGLGVDIDQLDALWREHHGFDLGASTDSRGSANDSSPWQDVVTNGLSVLLVTAALASATVLFVRARRAAALPDDDEPGVVQTIRLGREW